MPEKIYTYSGPLSAVSLAPDTEHPAVRDVQLMPGQTVSLPDDNDYVRSLVARKYLTPVVEPEPAREPASATVSKPAAAATATTGSVSPSTPTTVPSVADPTAETKGA